MTWPCEPAILEDPTPIVNIGGRSFTFEEMASSYNRVHDVSLLDSFISFLNPYFSLALTF